MALVVEWRELWTGLMGEIIDEGGAEEVVDAAREWVAVERAEEREDEA